MKITGVKFYKTLNPIPKRGGDEWYIIKITTDEGIYGWGEICVRKTYHTLRNALRVEIQTIAESYLIGQDPLCREKIWRTLYQKLTSHHADLVRLGIISGIDIALWDITGKYYDAPIYQLLGGKYRDKIPSYSYIYDLTGKEDKKYFNNWLGLWLNPELSRDCAIEMKEAGFKAIKLGPIPTGDNYGCIYEPYHITSEMLGTAERTIRLIREAVGDECEILLGIHAQLDTSSAILFAKRLEQYDPYWFEEPVPSENAKELAKVARATTIPIATGERLVSIFDFQRILEEDAVHIIQPDVCVCGGISELMKITALGLPRYVPVAPHVWGGPVMAAASIHLATTIPNLLIQECIFKMDGNYDLYLREPLHTHWKDGFVFPLEGPGLGIDLDEKALEKYGGE